MAGFAEAGPDPTFAPSAGEATAAFLLALRAQGVRHTAVLRAMERVSRGQFAPHRFADLARTDIALPLACGQTMTAPSTIAQMLVALDPQAGQSAIEVGAGSGYVAALLSDIGLSVTSLERYRSLALAAHERLAALGIARVTVMHGDGLLPPRLGSVDRIILNGVVEAVPDALVAQLAAGGRLVAAIRVDGLTRMVTVTRREGQGGVDHKLGGALRLPPLSPGLAQAL